MIKLGALCGLIAPILFAILVVAGGLLTPRYSQLSQLISELGQVGQPYALLQDANFVVTGMLIIVFGAALYRSIPRSSIATVGSVLLLGYPLAFVFVGTAFPLPSSVHTPLGVVGFFVSLVGLLINSWPMRRDAGWKRFGSFALFIGIISIAGFFVDGFLQSQGGFTEWLGLAQRLALAPYFVWIETMAVRLARKGPI